MKLRFRYSLRTLFVVVTLVACWFGYYINWIRQRHITLPKYVHSRVDISWQGSKAINAVAPWPLRWLGEEGYGLIVMRPPASEEEFERIKKLFPEADIQRAPPEQMFFEPSRKR